MRLDNKVAIVTGGGRGFGEGIVMRLAEEGAAVAVFEIDLDAAQRVVDNIEKAGGKAMTVKVDVTKHPEIKAGVAAVIERFGQIDILVNNAGAGWKKNVCEFQDKEEDSWRSVIELNVNGVFNCIHAVAKHMVERRSGKIINIASISAHVGIRRMVEYSASKGAVIAMTKALAMDVGPYGVNVNSVSPGAVRADAPKGNFEGGQYLPGPGGTPADVGAMVAFLASDDARHVTGADFLVDGGRILGPRGS